MKFSFAPLEGIGQHIYRSTHAALFPGADRYYAPFIAPDGSGNCKKGDIRDVLPENNSGLSLIPQILTNSAPAFIKVADELYEMGYGEVNLNVGCPSPTVVTKYKGAGMLRDLNSLDAFLSEIFEHCRGKISVKTRVGMESAVEFPAILELYNRYPIAELIIHARTKAGLYSSDIEWQAYEYAAEHSRAPLCYNGSINSEADFSELLRRFPDTGHIMLGRGLLANPALIRRLQGGQALQCSEFKGFHDAYLAKLLESGLSPHFALSRMKELWHYMSLRFSDCEKQLKALNKSKTLSDYEAAASQLFRSCRFSV